MITASTSVIVNKVKIVETQEKNLCCQRTSWPQGSLYCTSWVHVEWAGYHGDKRLVGAKRCEHWTTNQQPSLELFEHLWPPVKLTNQSRAGSEYRQSLWPRPFKYASSVTSHRRAPPPTSPFIVTHLAPELRLLWCFTSSMATTFVPQQMKVGGFLLKWFMFGIFFI